MGILFEIIRHLSDSEHYGKLVEAAERGEYALELAILNGNAKPTYSEEKYHLPEYVHTELRNRATRIYADAAEFWADQEQWNYISLVDDHVWYVAMPVDHTQFIVTFSRTGRVSFLQLDYVKGELRKCPWWNMLINQPASILNKVTDQIYLDIFGFTKLQDTEFHKGMSELANYLIDLTSETTDSHYKDLKEINPNIFYRIEQYKNVWLGVPFEGRIIAYPVVPLNRLMSVSMHDQQGVLNEQLLLHMFDLCRTHQDRNPKLGAIVRQIRWVLGRTEREPLDSIIRQAIVTESL